MVSIFSAAHRIYVPKQLWSSEPHHQFGRWLLALVMLPVAGLFALGIYLQPLYGDLTRLGFYSEREFGWNSPQVDFPRTQLEFSAPLDDAKKYYDVLVWGDSFSRGRPELQWQNYLVAATQQSVGTMFINEYRLSQVLKSRLFREHPPKVFIMESVERELPHRVWQNAQTCGKASVHFNKVEATADFSLIQNWKELLPDIAGQLERESRWSKISLDYVWKYLRHKLFGGVALSSVYKMDVIRPMPLTSREQRSLLIYHDDINKIQWWHEAGVSEMGCRIEAMRSQVEANGYTRFVLMVAPDKLTAYADYLSDAKLRNVSSLSNLADAHPEIMPRLDKSLIEAIHAGKQDVYLPDDTHWGSNGQRIAAETLISFLTYTPVQEVGRTQSTPKVD